MLRNATLSSFLGSGARCCEARSTFSWLTRTGHAALFITGVGLLYVLLWGSTKVLTDHFKLPGFKSGQYGDGPKPSLAYWGRQAAVYVACLLVMKLAVICLFAAWPYIFTIGEWLLSWTRSSNWVQVIV